jgi:malate dehydrogenase (oxaloacetate-decarboxylating)
MKGLDILNNPMLNKGTAFTQKERDELGLNGMLPCHISTIEEQVARRYVNFCEQSGDLAKYIFLSALQNRNEVLFYRLVSEHISEMLPYIYTPTVGDVSTRYSLLYKGDRGTYLSYLHKDKIEEIIEGIPRENVDVAVITDGERILGLGDLGVGGMAIPLGKLALYTVFGGIHPTRTLPIMLDVGTNNEELLQDPLYIGWKHRRITGAEYDAFVDRVVNALKKRFPRMLLQWEDFARPHAKPLLDRYRKQICSFNDDIQGTAAVALSAVLSAVKITRSHLKDQRIAVFGGGGAGLGICDQLLQAMMAEGVSEEEAKQCFYVVDRFGLIHTQLSEADAEQRRFARDHAMMKHWKVADVNKITLLDVVKHVHPTILIGVSAQGGAFTEEIVREMATHVQRPTIFPLSNPTSHCEATPEQLIEWTQNRAIIATGSPFPPVQYHDETYKIAQCNNVYIFPGLGLGVIASGAQEVTQEMFLIAANVLSDHSPMLKNPKGGIFPAFESLREVSKQIAIAVASSVIGEAEAKKRVSETMWFPTY